MEITFTINGQKITRQIQPGRILADFLREDLGLTGTKIGCGVGECGACTILIDGKTVNSCLLPAAYIDGHTILTIEGVSPENGPIHPIQEAFIEAGAVQCGYCIPGMVLSAKALLDQNQHPTDAEIAEAMSGNLCRCTGYQKILEGVRLASKKLTGDDKDGGAYEPET